MNEGLEKPTVEADLTNSQLNTDIAPLDNIIIVETGISEQEMAELKNEAEGLDIQPFEETDTGLEHNDLPQSIGYDAIYEGLNEYNFNGKEFDQNPEQLNGLLTEFTENNWNNLDLDGQKEQISGLFEYVNNVLDLENPPRIEYYNTVEDGDYGGYNPATNTLSINEYMLHDSKEAADTVAHELWHAYQHERASNPHTKKDFQYQFNFDNYISPGDDFDGYQNQLVEAEARAFADQFKGMISHIQRT